MSELIKVGELCDISSSKRIFAKEYQESGIPFFRGKEVTEKYNGKLDVTTELFISEEKYLELESKFGVPKYGDMLLTSVGTLGSTYIVKENDKFYFKDGNLTWFKNFNGLNSRYLQYWLESPEGKGQLRKSEIGSSQSAYTIANLKEMQISLPSLEDQLHVVSYIEKYDNLIENNNRRIAILEDMAQSLYREWFVNFRYPSHEDNLDADGKPKLVDSPLGQIPDGWEVKTAAEAITINPRTKLAKDGEKPFVGMSGLSESSMVINDIIEKSGNSGAKFINGDTLFARITPCLQNGKTGYVQFLNEERPVGFGSTEFIVLRESEDLSSEYIYLLSRSNNFREHAIKSMTGATGRQRVHPDSFASYYLAIPPKELMAEFTNLVKPMFKSIYNLSKRNENLKQQRDMLLPKLISGQIELKE
jgi:type I restriction enzyme S subunit